MRAAASPRELVADPVGRYYAGRSFVVWMQTPQRLGCTGVGVFDPADEPALYELFPLLHQPALIAPFDVVYDLFAIESFDRLPFRVLLAFLEAQGDVLRAGIRRLAMVRPQGLAGATASGVFHDWVRPPLENGARGFTGESALFESRREALDWLGVTGEELVELESMEMVRSAPLLRRLRDLIARDRAGVSVADAAAELGESSRSLQRHLAELGTSFRDELVRSRIEAAKVMLLETTDKIEVIARHLGFKSVPAFVTMFGDSVGEPPAAFRQRRRGTL